MLQYWIWFAQLKKLPLGIKQRLLEHFSDPEEIYLAQPEAFEGFDWLSAEYRQALTDKDLTEAERILEQCRKKGIRLLTMADRAFPARLKNTYDCPVLLYYRGILPDWQAQPVIGIVGTRKASSYGMNTALRFGMQIAACGALVVSGGAAGIDTMALKGALDTGKAGVCVLGCGVDVVYPKSNASLFAQVAENGCLISEYAPGTEPYSWNFPQRNRIISGISNGLLVVEAPAKSGALSSASHALEQGRDVFSVPGNVDMPSCAGSNDLLREGAMAALDGWDVVRQYQAQYPNAVARADVKLPERNCPALVAQEPTIPAIGRKNGDKSDKKAIDKGNNSSYSVVDKQEEPLTPQEQTIIDCMGNAVCLVDEVIERSGMGAAAVKMLLTKLTLKKRVIQHPGGRVSVK